MTAGAELGQYILLTQCKKIWRFNGGLPKATHEWTAGWS